MDVKCKSQTQRDGELSIAKRRELTRLMKSEPAEPGFSDYKNQEAWHRRLVWHYEVVRLQRVMAGFIEFFTEA